MRSLIRFVAAAGCLALAQTAVAQSEAVPPDAPDSATPEAPQPEEEPSAETDAPALDEVPLEEPDPTPDAAPAAPPSLPPPAPRPANTPPQAPAPVAPGVAPAANVPAGPYHNHKGIMLGIGIGLSTLRCDGDCGSDSSLGLDFNIGGFVSPRLALMYDAGGWVDAAGGATLTISTNTAAAQYWLAPRFWIKGGLGFARASLSYGGDSLDEFGLGATSAVGFELHQGQTYSIDLSGRYSWLEFEHGSFSMINTVVGLRWK